MGWGGGCERSQIGSGFIKGKEGALADLLLVGGNPLENLDLVADPDKNFVMIMKDGKICKNTVK